MEMEAKRFQQIEEIPRGTPVAWLNVHQCPLLFWCPLIWSKDNVNCFFSSFQHGGVSHNTDLVSPSHLSLSISTGCLLTLGRHDEQRLSLPTEDARKLFNPQTLMHWVRMDSWSSILPLLIRWHQRNLMYVFIYFFCSQWYAVKDLGIMFRFRYLDPQVILATLRFHQGQSYLL